VPYSLVTTRSVRLYRTDIHLTHCTPTWFTYRVRSLHRTRLRWYAVHAPRFHCRGSLRARFGCLRLLHCLTPRPALRGPGSTCTVVSAPPSHYGCTRLLLHILDLQPVHAVASVSLYVPLLRFWLYAPVIRFVRLLPFRLTRTHWFTRSGSPPACLHLCTVSLHTPACLAVNTRTLPY